MNKSAILYTNRKQLTYADKYTRFVIALSATTFHNENLI